MDEIAARSQSKHLNMVQKSTAGQRFDQNHKIRAIFHKCPYIRAPLYLYGQNLGTLAWQELPLRVLFTGKTKQATDCMVNDSCCWCCFGQPTLPRSGGRELGPALALVKWKGDLQGCQRDFKEYQKFTISLKY